MTESQLEKLMRRAGGAPSETIPPADRSIPEGGSEDDFTPTDYEPAEYKSFATATGKRQPGFTIAMVRQRVRYWIFYHSIRRLKSFEENGREYVWFSHDDLAVTIEGLRLDVLLTLIGEGRLKAVFEPNGSPVVTTSQVNQPIITGIRVTDIETGRGDGGLRLVKPV